MRKGSHVELLDTQNTYR